MLQKGVACLNILHFRSICSFNVFLTSQKWADNMTLFDDLQFQNLCW